MPKWARPIVSQITMYLPGLGAGHQKGAKAMPRKPSLKRVQNRIRLAGSSISSLTRYQLRKGKPISYGTLNLPTPNTVLGRTPSPFTGGN